MILEVKQLIKRYQDLLAVDHVNLEVKEGEIFGLLGPNGAGKTTTISAIAGLTRPDGGTIRMFGKALDAHEMEVKRQLGVVPQDLAIYEDLTAYENVRYFGQLYGLRGRTLHERVREALEFTGLYERRDDRPKRYSGGMKRRLNIACAIVHEPKLIIMDEPTVGIDPQSRNHILQSIRELNRRGATIIYTSHYMEEVEELCSYIVIMDYGRVIAQGTKEELKAFVSEEDKVTLALSGVSFTMLEDLKRVEGVKDVLQEGNELAVISRKNSRNLARIIDCVTEAGEREILSLSMDQPSLERVFLTLTGRSIRNGKGA